MRRSLLAGLALSALVSLVSLRSDAAGVSLIIPLDPGQGQFPESITADADGNVYLSMANIVWKVIPDGQHAPAPFAQLPIPAGSFSMGLKFGRDGDLYAASASFDPGADASHVWRISPSGAVSEYAHFDAAGFPNDLAFDAHGNLYVTDATFGVIYKVEPGGGQYSIWADDPLLYGNAADPIFVLRPFGADGLAFDAGKRDLYVDNLDEGTIMKIHIGPHGDAEDISLFASDPRLIGIDGLAFDERGTLYAAINAQNQIATIDGDGNVSIVATGAPLDGPSSLVFGARGTDKKTLYVSSFAIGEALGLVPGVPHPALSSMTVHFGGRPLP